MSIKLNDNIKINAGKPIDTKYLNTGNTAWNGLSEVTGGTGIPLTERYLGLTVLVNTGSTNVEYWFKEGVGDGNLIEKKFASEQVVGDFITGATNLGYFSGTTGIQTINVTSGGGSSYNGDYDSIYNYYYRDSLGVIRIGKSAYGEPFRRAYYNSVDDKSWVWDVQTSGWRFILGDVRDLVGETSTLGYDYGPTYYTVDEWSAGFYSSGSSASLNVSGDLTTGNTITIGEPIYRDKSNQELHLRSIINDTPNVMNIDVDDYYVRFSGVTSVITASNVGTGQEVFSGKTGTDLQFRTLVGSGDTVISTSGDELIFYTSISGQTAITGGTTVGYSGATPVYAGLDNKDIEIRSIIGSGDTTVGLSGDTIVVYSDSSGLVFTEDITVSLAGGKTFGKYEDGQTIPSSGKTAAEVIQLATFENIDPTASLSSSGNDVAFGESGKTVNLNFSYSILTPGASVSGTTLEWRRGGTGTWSGLTITTGDTSFNHSIDDSANRFNTDQLNYRYTVVDSNGSSAVATHNVNPQTYASPLLSIALNGTLDGIDETQNNREKGNVDSSPSGVISSNRSLVDITDWTLERRYDGGSWTALASGSGLNTQNVTIPSTPDIGNIPPSANDIEYRLTYIDEYTSGNGGIQNISFFYYSYYGYDPNTTLNSTQILALETSDKLNNENLTWNGVTSPSGEYTYYVYPSSYGDLTSIVKNGVLQDFGAWSQLSQELVTNSYGQALNYKVWKSNATQAYSGDNLVFS